MAYPYDVVKVRRSTIDHIMKALEEKYMKGEE